MTFSDRTPEDLSLNPIAKAIEVAKGKPVINLIQSNPTLCGFNYPADLLKGFSLSEALTYEPEAFGSLKAREVLAQHFSTFGRRVQPENLVLTASTSEAYSYLFKLLGNPGDAFLIPTPGYPLLDHLLHLEALELIPYPFKLQADWPVDLNALEAAITPRTKGIIVVDPHNPTGAFLSQADAKAILELCQKHSLAYISDEVFADYAYQGQPQPASNPEVLSFRLGGLSKSLGLPQLKLAWIEVSGPKALLEPCLNRLELIVDTYLSVNTPVQVALEGLLSHQSDIQKQIKNRVIENRKVLETALTGTKAKVWPAQAGWYALVEVLMDGASDEALVIELLKEHQVLVQPGGFYDFPEGCFLVLSLLPQLDIFKSGVHQLGQLLKG